MMNSSHDNQSPAPCCGGPIRKISVGGKLYEFEMHPYCGPTLLNKQGDPIDLAKHPAAFLHATSLWAQQGQRVENGLCQDAGIAITCNPKLVGRVWEQFHDGVMAMKRRLDEQNYKVSDGGPRTPELKQDANPPFAAPLG